MTIAAHRQLTRAHGELDDAARARADTEIFLHAHMAALRAAAAVTAGSSATGRRRLRSVWEQLAERGGPWEPWAERFAAGAPIRAGIESGQLDSLPPGRAAAALAAAGEFVAAVERELDGRAATLVPWTMAPSADRFGRAFARDGHGAAKAS
ncbi:MULTISPECIES: SAV_6107 family HEPN domain-containing protein [unclassified Pseudactinotalea]|uniref:SAV_6107 family HEPN domain-containing protein n=1 Tax=unclassified Pseudactinotalea TaxID=2649176 RepID=UPI00128DF35F|nr:MULTISPECIES: SAV_6107 family HEPN domain-containing protein [unclassified Pseudactinotalea]MPV49533.1 colicin transporter [Pseudactinotalea sp. HY160]QGH69842.1 colicin transporter [Pseudactinotalea sp. HY158]